MLLSLPCPACGDRGDRRVEPSNGAVSCRACGKAFLVELIELLDPLPPEPAPTEEQTIASWLGNAPGPADPLVDGPELACQGCGYTGPTVNDPLQPDPICPACGRSIRRGAFTGKKIPAPAQNQRFFEPNPLPRPATPARRVPCPDCGRIVTAEAGKTVICPGCNSFLGCLVPEDRGSNRWWRR